MGCCASAGSSPSQASSKSASDRPANPKHGSHAATYEYVRKGKRCRRQHGDNREAPAASEQRNGNGQAENSPTEPYAERESDSDKSGNLVLPKAKRRALAHETHFTEAEVDVLCKHYGHLSASRDDDGVIDQTEWEDAFQKRSNTSGLLSTQPSLAPSSSGVRGSSVSASLPTQQRATVSAHIINDTFAELPHMFVDRMFRLFDGDGNGEIDLEEFIKGLSVFSRKGTTEEKVEFAFRLYDIDNDGAISKQELRSILLGCLQEENEKTDSSNVTMSTARLDGMIDETFQEADLDGNGIIDYNEFVAMATRHPDIISNISFRTSILDKVNSQDLGH
ncbi:Calcineurin B-like protein 6 [Diplonema papillatum]|nr:Calcineurin B-like protein 6 [Diplonema papillatum]